MTTQQIKLSANLYRRALVAGEITAQEYDRSIEALARIAVAAFINR